MVEGCRRCDCKVISLIAIEFRVHAVQCKGHDRKHICTDGILRPGGVNLAGGYIFNIVFVADIVILCGTVPWTAIVNDNVFRNNHTAEYDFATFRNGLDLSFWDFCRIIAVKGMCRNNEDLFLIGVFRSRCGDRIQSDILQGSYVCQNLCTGNGDWLIAFCGNLKCIFGIGLYFIFGIRTVLDRRSREIDGFGLSGRVGCELFQRAFWNSGIGDAYRCVCDRISGDRRGKADLQTTDIWVVRRTDNLSHDNCITSQILLQ